MVFKAWSAFVDERDPIRVQCVEGGPEYTLPELPANIAHQYRVLMEDITADVPMAKWTPEDERTGVLGEDLHLQMLEDNVPDAFIARCVSVVIVDWQYGRDVAESAWEHDVDPKALAALVAAKMRTVASGTNELAPTDTATETRMASSRGTTSRKTTKRAQPRKTATSSGSGSRNTGRSSKRTG